MKKRLLLMLVIMLACLSAILFTACGMGGTLGNESGCVHDWDGDWENILEPTCGASGLRQLICGKASCEQFKLNTIDATQHLFGAWAVVQEATCLVAGAEIRVCSKDATHTEIKVIASAGHIWGDWLDEGDVTCDEGGKQIRTCETCNQTAEQTIEGGCNFGEPVETVAPTCDEDGEAEATCQRTGCTEFENSAIPALGCDWEEPVVIEPSCEESGSSTKTCERCGDSDIEVLDKLACDFEWTVVNEPTCTDEGLKREECKNCGAFGENEVIPIDTETDSGHNYIEEGDDLVCEFCGDIFDNGEDDTEPDEPIEP
ncbi:MAG: hypothetical protein FWD49_05200 [Firmicutes bacterium]|nr:hypothetical protein [Bacillota bacterium]